MEISFTLIVRTSKLKILLFFASIETFWQNSDRQNSEMLKLRIHVQLIAIEFALNLDSYKTCEIYLINNILKKRQNYFRYCYYFFFSLFTFRKLINSHNNHTE